MSDVSGIPNMGFGGGNFFAPQFSYNPQINPTAGYAGPAAYAQNVQNATIGDLQYDQKLFQHYYEQSLFGVANMPAPSAPGTFTDYNAGGDWPEGGRGGPPSPYHTSPNVFDTGASPFLGGGSSGLGGSIYGGGLGGGMSDFQSPSNNYGTFQGGWGGVSNNLNLGAGGTPEWSTLFPSGGSSGTSPIDWSHLFGGGGGAKADPAPGMSTPGGLGSPMTTPQQPAEPQQQQPGINWGNVGAAAGAGSTMPYTSGIEPDLTGGRTLTGDATSTATPQQQTTAPSAPDGTRTYDFKPMFEGGGGGGFGSGGAESQLFGAPAAGSLGGNPFSYIQDPSATKEAPGSSAEDMAAQGRAKLAELLGGTTPEQAAETTKAVEDTSAEASSKPNMADFVSPEQGYSDFQKAATPRTGYDADLDFLGQRGAHNSKMRPGGTGLSGIDEHIQLSEAGPYKSLSPELAARLRAVGEAYEAATGRRANYGETARGSDVQKVYWDRYQSGEGGLAASPENSRHRQGNAMDIPRGDFRDWAAKNGAQFGIVFPFSNDIVHVQMSPSYQGPNFVRPPADIPYPQGIPMPAERPAEAPARPFAAPPEQGQGVNEGQVISRPPADIPDPRVSGGGFNAIDAAAKHTGLELARANIDTPIEKIAMERGGQKAVDQVSSMAVGMTPRQLLQSYGGMFMSRAEPLFQSLGITRQDFDKAIAMPPTQQDIKMRFAEGGAEFGPYPAYAGPEAAPGGSYADFRQSPNVEDRRAELANLTNTEADPFWASEPGEMQRAAAGEATPLARDLGIGDVKGYEAQKIEEEHQRLAASPSDESADLPLPGQGRDIPAQPPGAAGDRAPGYWDIPKENTPEWNAGVYEPALKSGIMQRGDENADSGWSAFAQPGNVEDRRAEQLAPDMLAALKARGFSYAPGPEAASSPLGAALGLGDLPTPRGMAAAVTRPQSIAGGAAEDASLNNVVGPSSSAFDLGPGGFGEGGYGNVFAQPTSRADLASQIAEPGRVKMDFSGFSPSPEPRQGGVGPQAELTPDFMDVIKEVESSGNPDKVKGSYKGLYQLDDKEFRKYGGTGSIFDPEQNTKAASAKMIDETQRVQDRLGRALTPPEQYMVHQQGVAGALAHLANPDELAWKNFQGASGWNDTRAKTAIWDNMTNDMKKQFGNDVNNVTSRDFLRLWDDRYYGILNR